MILTLISLVALGAVFKGLYFFSARGTSPGTEEKLQQRGEKQVRCQEGPPKQPKSPPKSAPRHSKAASSPPKTIRAPQEQPQTHFCLFMGIGFRLYLSVLEEEFIFFTGANEGVSISSPVRSRERGTSLACPLAASHN